MVAARKLHPLPIFDQTQLTLALQDLGAKAIHIGAIWSYLLSNGNAQPHDVPNLPQAAYEMLRMKFSKLTSKVIEEKTSGDQTTTKLLIQLQDGQKVEAVIMRHDASAGKYAGGQRGGGPRATLCLSSQVGCQMGCTFCATGTMGLLGNLSPGEIVEQLVHALQICPIRNIVFMGMGEPLNNYVAVQQAVAAFTRRPFALSPAHITVSTVGVVPKMLSLAQDMPGVNLALSLHAPSQELRVKIVPAARAYPLHRLMMALDSYLVASGRRVLVEYVLLQGVNDAPEIAHQLGELLQPRDVIVNLIPYNPTTVNDQFAASSPEDILKFQTILREDYDLHATVRQEMGQDIGGACGQLVIAAPTSSCSSSSKTSGSSREGNSGVGSSLGPPNAVRDIEELCF